MSLKRLRKASSTVSVGIGCNVSKSSRSIHSSALGRERLAKSTIASRFDRMARSRRATRANGSLHNALRSISACK